MVEDLEILRVMDPFEGRKTAYKISSGLTLQDVYDRHCFDDEQVALSVNGIKVDPDNWSATIPSSGSQVLINPTIGDPVGGLTAIAGALKAAAAIKLPGIAATILGPTIGAVVLKAAVIVGGGYLLRALNPTPKFEGFEGLDKSLSQAVGWDPRTVQRRNHPIPQYYGRNQMHGSIVSDYIDISGANGETETLNLLLAFCEGPVEGIETDTIRINGQSIDTNFTNITYEEFKGTSTQAASTIVPDTKTHFKVVRKMSSASPYTYTTPDDDFDDLEVILSFPRGVYFISDTAGWQSHSIQYKVEISEKGQASWTTLVADTITGSDPNVQRLKFVASGTYTGGTPVTINRGTSYDIRITKVSSDQASTNYGDDMYLDTVQEVFNDSFSYPGLSYLAISAIATADISGNLDVSVVQKGKICLVYNGSTWSFEHTYNPAWILWNILTLPVITGDGIGTPYAVDHYRGIDPSKLDLTSFYNFSLFCDGLVPDGRGSNEARFEISRGFDLSSTIWDTALKICELTRSVLIPRGSKLKIVYDDLQTVPRQCFTITNTNLNTFERTILSSTEKLTELEITYKDEEKNFDVVTNTVQDEDFVTGSEFNKGTLELIGLRTESRAWRQAKFRLLQNRSQNFIVKLKTDVEALGSEIGDLIKIQSDVPIWGESIVVKSATSNTVVIQGTVTTSGTDSVCVRTTSATPEEIVMEKVVQSVTTNGDGDTVITITTTWDTTPSANDIGFFGPTAKVSRDFQVFDIIRNTDQDVTLWAIEYSSVPYDADSNTPTVSFTDYTPPDVSTNPIQPITVNDIANKVPSSIVYTNFNTDIISISGFTFTDNSPGAGSVAWTGGGLLYKGTEYTVTSGNTSSAIIFWDENSLPTTFKSTNIWSEAQGTDRHIIGYNDSGTFFGFFPHKPTHGQLVEPSTVDTTQLANLAVIEGKLADLAVATAKIANGAVLEAKLADLAVATGKLANLAVTEGKLGALAVTEAKIGALAITEGKIGGLAVTETKIASNSISTAKIQANAVTTNEIAAATIIAGDIASGTITTTQIAANTIVAGNIAAGTITTTEIAALTIVAGDIAAGTITTTQIATDTILAGNIAANAVTSSEIAANTIVAGNIFAGTITTTEIAANTIVAANIAANTITATEIAALTITANEIASNAVATDKVNALAITSAKIASDAVYTAALQANAVTADKINVSSLSAINADMGTLTAGTINLGLGGTTKLRINSSGIMASNNGTDYFNIIYNNAGSIVINADEIKVGTLLADRIASSSLTGITANFFRTITSDAGTEAGLTVSATNTYELIYDGQLVSLPDDSYISGTIAVKHVSGSSASIVARIEIVDSFTNVEATYNASDASLTGNWVTTTFDFQVTGTDTYKIKVYKYSQTSTSNVFDVKWSANWNKFDNLAVEK